MTALLCVLCAALGICLGAIGVVVAVGLGILKAMLRG